MANGTTETGTSSRRRGRKLPDCKQVKELSPHVSPYPLRLFDMAIESVTNHRTELTWGDRLGWCLSTAFVLLGCVVVLGGMGFLGDSWLESELFMMMLLDLTFILPISLNFFLLAIPTVLVGRVFAHFSEKVGAIAGVVTLIMLMYYWMSPKYIHYFTCDAECAKSHVEPAIEYNCTPDEYTRTGIVQGDCD